MIAIVWLLMQRLGINMRKLDGFFFVSGGFPLFCLAFTKVLCKLFEFIRDQCANIFILFVVM